MKFNWKRYTVYLFRWQLSTPILALCVALFASLGVTWATIIANFIGGAFFYFIDLYIFKSDKLDAQWEIKEKIQCSDCGKIARGYRLVHSKNYDQRHDKNPKFRCEECSIIKTKILEDQGIHI